MSKGAHNSSHTYHGRRVGRAARLSAKLGQVVTLRRLERLLREAQQLVTRAQGQR